MSSRTAREQVGGAPPEAGVQTLELEGHPNAEQPLMCSATAPPVRQIDARAVGQIS